MDYLRYIFALIFVLSMIGLFGLGLRKYGMGLTHFFAKIKSGKGADYRPKLAVKESLVLDPKRRLVVIDWNGEEHLLFLGPNGDMRIPPLPSKSPVVGATNLPTPDNQENLENDLVKTQKPNLVKGVESKSFRDIYAQTQLNSPSS